MVLNIHTKHKSKYRIEIWLLQCCARHLKHSWPVHVSVGQPKMLLRKLIFFKYNFYIFFYKFVQVKNKAGWKWVSHQLWIMSLEADQSPEVCGYADQSQGVSFPPLSSPSASSLARDCQSMLFFGLWYKRILTESKH